MRGGGSDAARPRYRRGALASWWPRPRWWKRAWMAARTKLHSTHKGTRGGQGGASLRAPEASWQFPPCARLTRTTQSAEDQLRSAWTVARTSPPSSPSARCLLPPRRHPPAPPHPPSPAPRLTLRLGLSGSESPDHDDRDYCEDVAAAGFKTERELERVGSYVDPVGVLLVADASVASPNRTQLP